MMINGDNTTHGDGRLEAFTVAQCVTYNWDYETDH